MKKSAFLFFLFLLLLLPNLAQAFHVLRKHEHEYFCTEKKVHIHKEEKKCILKYTFTNPFVDTYKKINFQEKQQILLEKTLYKDQFLLNKFITGKNLRAPPYPLFSLNKQPL